jgi:hypothetical protein
LRARLQRTPREKGKLAKVIPLFRRSQRG